MPCGKSGDRNPADRCTTQERLSSPPASKAREMRSAPTWRRRDIGGRFGNLGTRGDNRFWDQTITADQQAFGQRVGLERQVWPPSRRIQIADGGAHPATAADRRLGHADTVLRRAVIVPGVGDADLAGRLDQRVVNRPALVTFADLQRPAAAAVLVVGIALVTFHVPENRQYLAVAPTAIAELRPGIVVLRLAAHEDHAVDRRGAAQELPARDG